MKASIVPEIARLRTPRAARAEPRGHATASDARPRAAAASDSIDRTASHASGADRSAGWTDEKRGVNANLGDTEAALHFFYERHPALRGAPPADGTPAAGRLKSLHLWADAKTFGRTHDRAETYWRHDDSRALHVSPRDRDVAETIYASQAAPGHRSAATADAPVLHALERFVAQNRYDATIDRALAAYPTPGIDAKIVKSLLIEESGLDPNVGTNAAGYTGIAQLGKDLAPVSVASDPFRAIVVAAKALQEKARYLDQNPFVTYGRPSEDERKKFVVGSYNAGQGTISDAIREARGDAYAVASAHEPAASARHTANVAAIHWNAIVAPEHDPTRSPLYRAIPVGWGKAAKYVEISTYAVEILNRIRQ